MLEKPPDENLNLGDYLINLFSRIGHCFMNFFFCCCISRNDASVEEIIPCLGQMPTVDSSTQTDFLPRKIHVSQQVVQSSNVSPDADLNAKSDSTPSQESLHRSNSATNLIATMSPDLKSKNVYFRSEDDIIEPKVILDSNEDFTPIVRAKSVSFRLKDDICEPKIVHDTKVRSASDSKAKAVSFQSLYDFHDQKVIQELDDEIASDSDSFYTAEPMHGSKLSYDSDLGSYVDSGTDSTKSESYHTVEQASDQEEGECLSLRNLKHILGPSVKNVGHGNVELISVSPCPDICSCSKASYDSGKGSPITDIERINNSTEEKYSSLEQRGSQEPDSVPSSRKGSSEKERKYDVRELNNFLTGVSSVPWPDDFRDFEEIDLEEEV
uniref:Uncharacterized protein n=1 Tax=Octopus bimaculoides TaxID=37653 RepID=A0A0L8GX42_OCTBM